MAIKSNVSIGDTVDWYDSGDNTCFALNVTVTSINGSRYNLRAPDGGVIVARDHELYEVGTTPYVPHDHSVENVIEEVATEWFDDNFDEVALEILESSGVISQAEGFRMSCLATLQIELASKLETISHK